MRNVPERPYKCNQCPSSTFSTLSNLNKHLFSKHNRNESKDPPEAKPKNVIYQGPPNVTISPTGFPLSLPRALSIIPQFPDSSKSSGKSPNSHKTKSNDSLNHSNGRDKFWEESRAFRKRSSSDETEATEKKRTSPDLRIVNQEAQEMGN